MSHLPRDVVKLLEELQAVVKKYKVDGIRLDVSSQGDSGNISIYAHGATWETSGSNQIDFEPGWRQRATQVLEAKVQSTARAFQSQAENERKKLERIQQNIARNKEAMQLTMDLVPDVVTELGKIVEPEIDVDALRFLDALKSGERRSPDYDMPF